MSILVVDDDMLNVKLTSFLLEEAGYRVIKAYDAEDALRIIARDEPDLILLDVAMPKTSGFDICRQIRRISDVPIIFLSARSQLQDRVTGLQIGGDDYLVKPFEPMELLARIEAVLRRRNNDLLSPVTRLSWGGITLDPIEQVVILPDNRTVTLTKVEFRLLYYLMQNAGRVLSTSQILDKVWGHDDPGGSNLVAVYISRLRAKIDTGEGGTQHILTVPNLGYKFAV